MATAHEYRCSNCGKLLYKGSLLMGFVELKCRRCHTVNIFGKTNMPSAQGQDTYSFTMTKAGRLVAIGPRATAFLEYTKDELLGFTLFDIDKTVTPAMVRTLRQAAASTKQAQAVGYYFSAQTLHTTKSGTLLPVDVATQPVIGGSDWLFESVCRVQSGQEATQHFMVYASQHLGSMVAVITLDNTGRCRSFSLQSNQAEQLGGYALDERIDTPIWGLFGNGQDGSGWEAKIAAAKPFLAPNIQLRRKGQRPLPVTVLFFVDQRSPKTGPRYLAYIAKTRGA